MEEKPCYSFFGFDLALSVCVLLFFLYNIFYQKEQEYYMLLPSFSILSVLVCIFKSFLVNFEREVGFVSLWVGMQCV